MAYRPIKRVIGETSLERKCRFLFGACLLLLISVAFWWVEHLAEGLVEKEAMRKGRDLVDLSLLRYHYQDVWESDAEAREVLEELSRDLETQRYDWDFLALEEFPETKLPANPDEEAILHELKAKLQEQLRSGSLQVELDKPSETGEEAPPAESFGGRPTDETHEIQPEYHFETETEAETGKIIIRYYQPVYWKKSCIRCHINLEGLDAYGRADAALFSDPAKYPLRVVKVTFEGSDTQNAITANRAILGAIGILTVFLAMVFLYVIIRYVVVKPLKHLRDVSEEISRGNTELRAEIHTNDEFEELANAFNRMLRHLTEAQAELREVNVDLDAKVDQLAQLNMRLYEMNRLKSDFLTNMSHEVRTPLNSIIGFSEVLQGIDALNDKQKRYAQNIQTSGRLLLDLINDILDLAKIEAGKMNLRPAEFRIDAVVNAQCDVVRSLTEEKNIDLDVQVQPDLPVLYQDQSKIQQILLNLLSNAIKFTPEGGRITVSAKQDARERLVMSVADTGVGIAEEDSEIIFEKFRQSSQAAGERNLTREYSGTGLGLSIVKEICKLLGGEITFQSVLGKGSTFTVVLPWALANPAQRESELEAQLDELVKSQPLEFHKKRTEDPQPDLSTTATS